MRKDETREEDLDLTPSKASTRLSRQCSAGTTAKRPLNSFMYSQLLRPKGREGAEGTVFTSDVAVQFQLKLLET
nr:hypothetical protein Iba_chr09eCG4660 [Ipomoea batatas]